MAVVNIPRGSLNLSKDILLLQIPREPDLHWIERIQSKYGSKVRWVHLPWRPGGKLDADSIALSPETWNGVTLACLFLPHPANLMSNVRYVQLTSAGADKWVDHEVYMDANVIFCAANGTHSTQVAEWVIGTWLMMRNSYLGYAGNIKHATVAGALEIVQDSTKLRMGILGYGAIGRQCARLASAMGVEVYAFTRSDRSSPERRRDISYTIPGLGDSEGLIPKKWFHGSSKEAVHSFLNEDLDILVLALPLTEETVHLLDREAFKILAKRRSFISNVARGKLIDTDALVEALREGQIRGAALDVTDPEPLPSDHPLFSAPNVFITPHISWWVPTYFDRILDILEINLDRLSRGEQLLNIVNKDNHY